MNPDDSNLDGGYDTSVYSSSLEGRPSPNSTHQPEVPLKNRRLNIPLFKLNRVAVIVTLVALLLIIFAGVSGYLYDRYHHNSNAVNSQEATGSYAIGSSLSVKQANAGSLLNLGQVNELEVNGQLRVSNSLVLAPSALPPSSPVVGEIYYNKTANQPYYYNGTNFESLTPQGVTSIGGSNGSIGLGNGLTISGGNLSVSNSLYQLINQTLVNSIQGQKGNLTFTAGNGISINGTQISNTGVLSINSPDNSINVVNNGDGTYSIYSSAISNAANSALSNLSGTSINQSLLANSNNSLNLGSSTDAWESLYAATSVLTPDVDTINPGTLSIGTITATAVSIGASGVTTTNNGLLSVSGLLTATDGLNVTGVGETINTSGGLTVTNAGDVAFQKATDISATGLLSDEMITGALVRFTGASAQTLTGIAPGLANPDGRILTIVNAGTNPLTINNDDTTDSSHGDLIFTGTGGNISLASGASISMVYDVGADSGNGAWRVEGSAPITGGAGGANTALSNLTATSINQSLVANANNTYNLGSSGDAWASLYGATSVLTPKVDTISAGTLSLGTSTATAITIGSTGVTTTNAGNLTVTQLLTASNGLTVTTGAVNLTGTSGAIALSGLGTSSINTGSNNLTVTSGNFTTTATGINGTAIGATTASTGAFTSLTSTGTTTLGSNSGSNVTIGNATGTLGLVSSNFNLNTSGALSGITGYIQASGNFLQSGSGTFTTGTGSVSLQGATTVTGSNSFSVNSGPTVLGGTLQVNGASSLNGGATISGLTVSNSAQFNTSATITGTLDVQGASITSGIPGSSAGSIILANSSGSNSVSLTAQNPSSGSGGNANVVIPSVPSGSTDYVCLETLANCGSTADSVTYSSPGAANTIAKFTGAGTIANSGITDDGTTVTISELLTANTISTSTIQSSSSLNITPGSTLTAGSQSQTLILQGSASTTFLKGYSGSNYTELGFVAPTGANDIQLPNASGTVCLDNSVSCGFAVGGSGVTSLNSQTGAVNIADASGSSGTVTIQNASTTQEGITEFNSNDFSSATPGIIDTIQGIATSSNVQFGSLGLGVTCTSGNLCLSSTGTVSAATISDSSSSSNLNVTAGSKNINFSILGGNEQFVFPTGLPNGTYNICVSNGTCATGGGNAVLLLPTNEQTFGYSASSAGLWIDDTSSSTDLVHLQTGSTPSDALVIDGNGNATFSNTTTAATLDVTGTLQANTITPSSNLTIGAASDQIILQGNQSSKLSSKDSVSGYTTNVAFDDGSLDSEPSPTGNVTYYFENNSTITPGSYEICTKAGNCNGAGGALTGSGTAGAIAIFTGPGNVGDSSYLSEGSGSVTDTGNLISDGNLTLGTASTSNGSIQLYNSSNGNTTTLSPGVSSSNLSFILPTTAGSSGQCLTTNGSGVLSFATCLSGTGSGVTSLNSQTGVVNIADASGSSGTVTIQNASTTQTGITEFNSSDFSSATPGIIDTIQGIATSSSPTFAGLTLGNTSSADGKIIFQDGSTSYTQTFNQATLSGSSKNITIPNASGTLAVSASGNLAEDGFGNLTISNSPTFSVSVTTPEVTSTGALALSSTGALTLTSGTGNVSTGTNTINGAAISGGTLSGGSFSAGSVSGGTLTGSAVDGLNVSSTNVGGTGALTVSSGGSGALTLTSASTLAATSSDFNLTSLGALTTTGAIQGVSFDANTAAGLIIGGVNATSLTLGRSGVGTAVSGLLTASNGLTVTTGAVNLTGTSGAIALSGLGTSSINTGSNNLTVTSGNFTTTATGINGTAIGATTASTGAFTSLTSTGTTTLGSNSGSNVTIGNATGTLGLVSSNFNLNTSGALSGITGYIQASGNFLQSGSGTFTTGTGSVSLQGATTVSNNLTVTNAGDVAFQKATDISATGLLSDEMITGALVRFTGASAQTLTGIAPGLANPDGRILTIVNAGTNPLTINNDDTTDSSHGDLIFTGTGGNISLASGASISMVYDVGADSGNGAWRVEGSAPITGGAGGANTALSNLTATSINQSLVANANNTYNLGSSGDAWASLYGATSVLTPKVDTISAGTLSLGTSTATAITIGSTGVTTTNAGNLTVTQLLTASNGLTVTTGAVNLTGTSGAIALSGLGTSSINTGSNNLTVTSGNFTTTATGINGTAIGATTASTGAFTNLTSTGTTTLGSSSGSNVTIGNATGTLGITSSHFSLSASTGQLTIQGGGTSSSPDITTASSASTANGIFIQSGTTTNASTSGSAVTIQGGTESGTSGTGGAVNINGGTGATNGSINIGTSNTLTTNIGASTGTAITLATSSGIGISDAALSSGTAISIGLNSLTSGTALSVVGTESGTLSGYSGNLINIAPTRTETAAGTLIDSGNYLNINRSDSESSTSGSGTYEITGTGNLVNLQSSCAATNSNSNCQIVGSMVNIQSSCSQTSGTCSDTENILNLNQADSAASGAVLNIQNSGTGNAINFAQTSTIGAGTNTTAGGTGYSVTLQGGSETASTGNITGGSVTIQGGNATSSSGTKTGGSVNINAGTGSYGNGSINIGTSNVANILLGDGSSTLTFQGTGATTLDGNLSVGTSTTAGNITFSSGGSANNYTVTLAAYNGSGGSNYTLYLPTLSGGTVPTSDCLQSGSSTGADLIFASCTAASRSKQLTLTAEYAGAVLDSASDTAGSTNCSTNNIGTMISGYSGDSSPRQNYYQWTTSQSGTECYDVVVQVPIPNDWSSWTGNPTITEYNSSGTASSVALSVINSSGSEDGNYSSTLYNAAGSISSSTLTAETFPALSGMGYSPSTSSSTNYLTLKIRLSSTNGSITEIGNISIPYTSSY